MRLRDTRLDPLAQDVALKLCEDREHPCHGAPHGRRQVERFGERNETDAQLAEFPERYDQVQERTPPAVELPNNDGVQLAPPCRLE